MARRSVKTTVGIARQVVVGVVVVAAALVVAAPPAAADTDLDVEVGYADGQIVPGLPVPVRVQVRPGGQLRGAGVAGRT